MSLPQESLVRELEKRLGRELSADEKRLLMLAGEITEVEKDGANPKSESKSVSGD